MWDHRLVSSPYVCVWIILIPNEYNFLAHTHLAIKERQIASEY
jgi:hypothetical protein